MSATRLARGLILALCITSALLTGCESSRERKLLNSNPAAIYKIAHDRMESGDYKASIKLLEALTARFPFTEQSRQAHLDLIYCYYKDGESESAHRCRGYLHPREPDQSAHRLRLLRQGTG